MNTKTYAIGLMTALMLSYAGIVKAETKSSEKMDDSPRARMGDSAISSEFRDLVDDATRVYTNMIKGSQGEVPSDVLKNARCIAIIPNVVTGALVVGGTRGEGLVSCRNNGKWSDPTPVTLSQGSIGLQVGAKTTDLVLFIKTPEAESRLKRGNLRLGADASVAAGKFGGSIDTPDAGVVAYAQTEGVFAGASISGSSLSIDTDELDDFYGRDVDNVALLDGRLSPDTSGYSRKLTSLFPA